MKGVCGASSPRQASGFPRHNVYDYGYGEFLRILEYVGRQYGTRVVKVDRFFPSTQLCSACGYQNTELRGTDALSIRKWDCPSCGAHHDRDRNAATNIHREGLRLLSGA